MGKKVFADTPLGGVSLLRKIQRRPRLGQSLRKKALAILLAAAAPLLPPQAVATRTLTGSLTDNSYQGTNSNPDGKSSFFSTTERLKR
ncbi:MAG: hypothetical protein LBS68_00940 [Puniceicoccales bacterium]|nr:hypothetical protein [Puniceicoccales bacterium]